MHLLQILLPLYDNQGRAIAREQFHEVRQELTERFGGLTVYSRAPAEGLWKDDSQQTTHDDLLLFEIMVGEIDRPWWKEYRQSLESRFRQETVVVRAQEITLL
jgi:hypothetical protein